MLRQYLLLVGLIAICGLAAAQPPADDQSSAPLSVHYGSVDWNVNSHSVDTAYMFVRDKKSGKVAKILLEETAPDSSQFEGRFSIQFASGAASDPEFFAPPKQLAKSGDVAEFTRLLNDNKIKPREILRRNVGNKVVYDVFDTKQQADDARRAYAREVDAQKKQDASKYVKPKADDTSLQLAAEVAKKAAMAKLAKDAADKEADRVHMQQLEEQKRAQKKKEMEALAEDEQRQRRAEAARLAADGTAHYMRGEFADAEPLYRKATGLDPANREYYFKYGVSLYRLEKLNEALVAFKIAGSDPKTDLEKSYYMGLIYYKMKDLAQAKVAFGKVKAANDPTLSPSAAFYLGLVLMAEDKLNDSKNEFEYVVDKSTDTELDKKADEYIEQIANMIAYKKMAAKKWILSASASLLYDSDILLQPNNGDVSTGQASDQGGARTNEIFGLERRLFFREQSELSAKANANVMYSFDSNFESGDIWDFNVQLPYARKGTWQTKGYKLTFTPGWDMMYLDYNSTGVLPPPLFTESFTFDVDFLWILRDNWFSDTLFNFRRDMSEISGDTDNNLTAWKYALRETETVFLDQGKKQALSGFLGYTLNDAIGVNDQYWRIDAGAIYSTPFTGLKNMTWNLALMAYHIDYASKNNANGGTGETDDNVSLTAGVAKQINDRWGWTGSATYIDNASDISASAYTKYIVLGTGTYTWDDAPKIEE